MTARDNKWARSRSTSTDVDADADADAAAAALLRFAANVDTSRHEEPACLGVITSTGPGGRREDVVHVIPIGTLGP